DSKIRKLPASIRQRLLNLAQERNSFELHASAIACSGSTGTRSVIPMARCYMPREHRSKWHKLNSGTLTCRQLWKFMRTPVGALREDAVKLLADQLFPSWIVVEILRRKTVK